jgi:hypothetical protein
MICWTSEGITVRAELPNGVAHAALESNRRQKQFRTFFMMTSEVIVSWMLMGISQSTACELIVS